MIAHIVMLRPSSTLSPADQTGLLDAMRHAFSSIPEILRARIGRRTVLGRQYDALAKEHFEYTAILEFETEATLRTYLDHPAHAELGQRFYQISDAAVAYDFVMVEPDQVHDLIHEARNPTS